MANRVIGCVLAVVVSVVFIVVAIKAVSSPWPARGMADPWWMKLLVEQYCTYSAYGEYYCDQSVTIPSLLGLFVAAGGIFYGLAQIERDWRVWRRERDDRGVVARYARAAVRYAEYRPSPEFNTPPYA